MDDIPQVMEKHDSVVSLQSLHSCTSIASFISLMIGSSVIFPAVRNLEENRVSKKVQGLRL